MSNDPNNGSQAPSKRRNMTSVLGIAGAIVVGIVVLNVLLPYIIAGALLFACMVWLERQ